MHFFFHFKGHICIWVFSFFNYLSFISIERNRIHCSVSICLYQYTLFLIVPHTHTALPTMCLSCLLAVPSSPSNTYSPLTSLVYISLSLSFLFLSHSALSTCALPHHTTHTHKSTFSICKTTKYFSFWVWFTSLNIMSFSSIHFPVNAWLHFSLELHRIPLYMCTTFIHWSADGPLSWFHVVAIVNSTAINTDMQGSMVDWQNLLGIISGLVSWII